MISKF